MKTKLFYIFISLIAGFIGIPMIFAFGWLILLWWKVIITTIL